MTEEQTLRIDIGIEGLLRFIKLEIATHTQQHPEHVTLSDGLVETVKQQLLLERQKAYREVREKVIGIGELKMEKEESLEDPVFFIVIEIFNKIKRRQLDLLQSLEAGLTHKGGDK